MSKTGGAKMEGETSITITIEANISLDDLEELRRSFYYGMVGRAIQNLLHDVVVVDVVTEEGVE